MKKIALILIVINMLTNFNYFAFASYDEPSVITSQADLENISSSAVALSGNYILGKNIQLNDNYVSIQNFSGTFDGNGKYIIFNKTLNGLFASTTENAVIQNLNTSGSIVSAGNANIGAIAGVNNGIIKNCRNYASVDGKEHIGGIVGHIPSEATGAEISYCNNFGDIYASYWLVGGIAGYTQGGKIYNCGNTGNISAASSDAGGVIGRISGSVEVTMCYNSGDVTTNFDAGGIAGASEGTNKDILNCFNSGKVTAKKSTNDSAGGIIGISYKSSSNKNDIHNYENCYNSGSVYINGNDKTSTHSIYGSYTKENDDDFLPEVKNCYYISDSETSEKMQTYGYYNGWDFETIWEFENGEYKYPVIKGIAFYSEKPEAVYEINSAEDFKAIADFPSGNYKLMKNLNLGNFSTISTFSGVLDGNGKYIESENALFNTVARGAVVKNLNVNGISKIYKLYSSGQVNVTYGNCILEISNVEDFKNIAVFPSAQYILTDNISLNDIAPVEEFSGTLDGNGFYIESNNYIFRELTDTAILKNINFGGNENIAEINSGNIENCTYNEYVFQIKTENDFLSIGNFPKASYVLMSNITLNNYMPQVSFSGSFNGNGKTVEFKNAGNGLFRELTKTGVVTNVITIGNINSSMNNIGSIAGRCEGIISECDNYADVRGENGTGGIAGCLAGNGKILNCNNYGIVESANTSAGGIIGWIQSGKVESSCNNGNVIAESSAGGISGKIYSDAAINSSFNNGDVYAIKFGAGGIAGESEYTKGAILNNCINTGGVIKAGKNYAQYGGIIKKTQGVSANNCYYLSLLTNISSLGEPLSYEEIESYIPIETEMCKVEIKSSVYGEITADKEYANKGSKVSIMCEDEDAEIFVNNEKISMTYGKADITVNSDVTIEGIFSTEVKQPKSPVMKDIYTEHINVFDIPGIKAADLFNLIDKKAVIAFGEISKSNAFYELKDYGYILYNENIEEIKRLSAFNGSDNLNIGGVFYGELIDELSTVYVSLYALYTDSESKELILESETKQKMVPKTAKEYDFSTKIPSFKHSEEILGMTAFAFECVRATSGMTKLGNRTYISYIGSPSYIYEYDTLSGEFINHFPIGSGQLYSFQVGSDGMLYISPNGNDKLYKYNPETQIVEECADYVSGNGELTWHMNIGANGNADKLYTAHYFANYEEVGGNPVGEYDVTTGEVTVYDKVSEGVKYMHSATGNDKYILAGYGSTAGTETVVRIDKTTGERKYWKNTDENIGVGTMIQTTLIDNLLFLKFGGWSVVIDIDTMTEFARFESGTRGGRQSVTYPMPESEKVYYLGKNEQTLMEFDMKTGETKTNVRFQNPSTELGVIHFGHWVKKENGEWAIVALLNDEKIGLITPGNRQIEYITIKMPSDILGAPTRPNYYYVSEDDILYVGGYEAGLNGFDLKNNKMLFSVSNDIQHGMVMIDNILLGGTYPNGKFYMYNPEIKAQTGVNPAHVWTAPSSIIRFYNAKETNAGFGLWAGVTDYGGKQGAVILGTVIDKVPHFKAYENVIPGENIVSVEYKDGYIYASSSVTVNLNEFHNEAHIAKIDAKTGEVILTKSYSIGDITEIKRIGELAFGPDGLLYASLSKGSTVAAIDPDTLEIVKYKTYYPDLEEEYGVYPFRMIFGAEGTLYTIMNNTLHAIDIDTMDSTVIWDVVDRITLDNDGNILKKLGNDSNSNYMSRIEVNQRERLEIMLENSMKYYRKDSFSNESWSVYEKALNEAKKIDFNASTDNEIYTVARNLSKAIKNLKTKYDEEAGFAYPFN